MNSSLGDCLCATKAGRPKDDTASDGWWWLALEDGAKAKVRVLVALAERTAAMARAEMLNFILGLLKGFPNVLVFYALAAMGSEEEECKVPSRRFKKIKKHALWRCGARAKIALLHEGQAATIRPASKESALVSSHQLLHVPTVRVGTCTRVGAGFRCEGG